MLIDLKLIQNSPTPIRTARDEDKLNELAQSLKEQGLIQPIKLRPIDFRNGVVIDEAGQVLGSEVHPVKYEIVYGHRRVEAARRAGFVEIDATIEDMSDDEAMVQALIENIQREDMTPLDTARALKVLKDTTGWSNMDIERQGILTNVHVSRLLALLEQPKSVLELFNPQPGVEPLTEQHVRQVRQVIPDDTLKTAVLQKASDEGLSASQTRRVAESIAAAPSEQAQQVLLEQPYSQFQHDPDFIKERAERYGAHDPLYSNGQKSTLNQDWQNTPEVSNIISTIQAWKTALAGFREAGALGKMSPEARGFIARRVRQIGNSLLEWANQLESEGVENGQAESE